MKSLNIKDPEVYRMASAISHETGESMTHVVREALQERFERLPSRRKKASLAELHAFVEQIAGRPQGPVFDYDDWLYDENGLPK
jgi:antitoxin VapB